MARTQERVRGVDPHSPPIRFQGFPYSPRPPAGGGLMSEAFREIAGKSQKNYGIYSKNGDKLISGVYTFVLQGRGGRNVQGMA